MFPITPAPRMTRGLLLAVGTSAVLSACYVIPMNPDGSPALQYLPPAAVAPALAPAPVVAVPATPAGPPMPATYQARLYPMNERAAQTGQLVATITDLHTGRGMLTMNLGGE